MSLGSTVTAAGFWLGTLLPILYLPVFVIGVDSISRLGLIVLLLTIHVVALVVGHDYPSSRPHGTR